MTEELNDKVMAIFKSDMETAEKMDSLIDNHGAEEISDVSIESAEKILENVDTPVREKYVYATLFQIGKAVGNDQLANFAAEKLQAWVEQHG